MLVFSATVCEVNFSRKDFVRVQSMQRMINIDLFSFWYVPHANVCTASHRELLLEQESQDQDGVKRQEDGYVIQDA